MGNILVTIDEIEKVAHSYIWRRPLGAALSSDESTTLCAICIQREPYPVALRRLGKKIESQSVCCDVCSDWIHCYCADVDYETVSAGCFTCDKCF